MIQNEGKRPFFQLTNKKIIPNATRKMFGTKSKDIIQIKWTTFYALNNKTELERIRNLRNLIKK